ncbi:MAG TPA: phage tail sheath family protein [Candidatus Blautia faecipullorum]|nr:phage tail sheath family protein [Candidatus Blautia faecipullorum]
MAGGTFKTSQKKVRPGTYVNVTNGRLPSSEYPLSGIAMIPIIGYDWGPRDEWIHLMSESPDAAKAKLGRSVYDDNDQMMLLRLILLNATEVWVYITGGGEKASGSVEIDSGTLNAVAKYAGTRGNTIKVVSVANPLGGYDVSVLLDGIEVELFERAEAISDLAGSAYVDFTGEGTLKEFASLSLEGGTDSSEKTNSSVTSFLDAAEKIRFNCMAFPTNEESLITALITKIKYIRNTIGWKCHAVVADTKADYEGIYNLTNSFEYEGKKLSTVQATAWLAGAAAAADYKTSLTYAIVQGATAVVGEKSNEEAVESIKNGKTFFSVDESGNVILEYDVNSKVTIMPDDPVDIYKGRPCRVYDSFANELLLTFVPGRYSNNANGYDVIEGLGRAMLKKYSNDGAIKNVDVESDFVLDRGQSQDDYVYISVGIQPVDSIEKYYFTVIAR